MTTPNANLTPPLAEVSSSELVRLALNNIVASILKDSDAPASSASHMDKAIVTLLQLCPDWKPWDDESKQVVEWAKEHMAYYQKPNARNELRADTAGGSKGQHAST